MILCGLEFLILLLRQYLQTNPWLSELLDFPQSMPFTCRLDLVYLWVSCVHYQFRRMIFVPHGVMARTRHDILSDVWYILIGGVLGAKLILETPHIFTYHLLFAFLGSR